MEKKYFDRELSWIKFNERVLEEAADLTNPLMERLKFISIFQSNYEEFFRVRVGTLTDELLVGEDEKDVSSQLEDIFKATKKVLPKLDKAYEGILEDGMPYFTHVTPHMVTDEEHVFLKQQFEREIAPVIAPFIVEKKNPFPFIDNAQQVVGVTLQKKSGGCKFGFIPVRSRLPKVVFMPGAGNRFILMEDIISMFAHKVFHKFQITEKIVFSIIRNADIDENEGLYDYDVDFRETMSKLIDLRRKLAPVEVKYRGNDCSKIRSYLQTVLRLPRKQFFCQNAPLSMGFLSLLEDRLPKDVYAQLYNVPMEPQYPETISREMMVADQIRKHDVLLSYPFDDIQMLIDLLEQCAEDKRVTEIKITLYRVSSHSRIVTALIDAARRGIKVTCVVELRARFDEENNIDWSKRMEEAGCRVVYGLPNYKVHCKLLLIKFGDGGKNLAQIGTGNFNEVTARLYTDLALFTAHREITEDVDQVFECLCAGKFVEHSRHLLVAPLCLKSKLIDLIDQEIAKRKEDKPCGIILKMNSLTDKDLINKLSEAADAGVKVQMIIRGICCLKPGKGQPIEIRSIVGRLLEHSRIYAFGAYNERKYYISSADFMTRNTTQRVEVAVPVYDYKARMKLADILRRSLVDNQKARLMREKGTYYRPKLRSQSKPRNMQMELYRQAYEKHGLPIEKE